MTNFLDSHITNLLFLAFGVMGSWRGWRDVTQAHASLSWPAADGEIVRSEVLVDDYHDDGSPMRRAAITYRYDVHGETYLGARVCFGDEPALRFVGPGKRRLAAYPLGSRVSVAYDPDDPRRAVLERGAGPAAFITCIVSAVVAAFGLGGLLASG